MAKSNSEFKSIQKKLVAAVAMVLVASIMVVSSSYAWFTLSTAPEVTGIQTSVGSNGNLEMALINTTLAAIDTATGGSMNFPQANYSWGNLVNLEDASYNLEGISLLPSRLNLTPFGNDGHKLGDSYLKAPAYGVDGRISSFTDVPYSGTYDGGKGYFIANQTTGVTPMFGVRAIGTTSGLSPEKMVLLEAISLMNSTKDSVIRKASASLSQDAIDLANIMMRGMLADKPADVTLTKAEFTQVDDAVKNLRSIVTELKKAMDQVVKAVGASQKINVTSIAYGADAITATGTGADNAAATVVWTAGDLPAMQTYLLNAYKVLFDGTNSPNQKLTDAEGKITNAGTADTYAYTTVEEIMKCILDTNDMLVRGNAGENKENVSVAITMANKDDLITIAFNSLTAGEPVNVDITGGIYHSIHDFVGHFYGTAKLAVDLTDTKFEDQLPAGMAKITVNASLNVEGTAPIDNTSYYLPWFSNKLTNLDVVGDSAGSDDIRITDAYGYAIDLGFRTNAVGSNLMLQTSAASRVDGNLSEGVQGGGSYMKFQLAGGTNGDENYTVQQMTGLMDAIRIVLADFNTGEIYGIAKLDVANAAVTNETVGGATVTYVTAYLNLYNYTFADGKLTIGEMKQANQDGATAITALQQNIALGISAMVYLDGDYVENSDVAIRGDSAVGTLNLQFSSSADLEPMDYTFSENQTPATPADPTLDTSMATPSATLSEKSLTIGTAPEGVTKYVVTVDDNPATAVTISAGAAASAFDLSAVLTGTNHTIKVVAYNETANTYSNTQTLTYSTT